MADVDLTNSWEIGSDGSSLTPSLAIGDQPEAARDDVALTSAAYEIASVSVKGATTSLLVWDPLDFPVIPINGGSGDDTGSEATGTGDPGQNIFTIPHTASPFTIGLDDGQPDLDGALDGPVLVESIVLGGVSGAAGDAVRAEYSYSIEDEDGRVINVYALSVNGNVLGLSSDAPLTLGKSYAIVEQPPESPVDLTTFAESYVSPIPPVEENAPGAPGQVTVTLDSQSGGNDTLTGDFADGVTDTVVDNSTVEGDDILEGGAGNDVIYGDSGNSLSAGGEGVPGTTLGDGPGSTGGGYDRISGQSVYNGNHTFSTDAFYLGNDIPVLDDANRNAITGVSFSQDGEGTDRTFGLDELTFTGAQRSFVGLVTVQNVDVHNANDQFSSSISGGFQDVSVVSSGTADFTMNDGQVFQGIRVNFVRGPDGETYMMPDDGPSPFAQNAFRAMLFHNSSGIDSFTIATGSGDDAGINSIEGNWADGQFFELTEGDGGDDTIIGGEDADVMFGEGGDDTFLVGSAQEGAGDVITGGNGPDQTTDFDVLDLRGAGVVTIDEVADADDIGATTGTVTFNDGEVLTFSQIEEILADVLDEEAVRMGRLVEETAPFFNQVAAYEEMFQTAGTLVDEAVYNAAGHLIGTIGDDLIADGPGDRWIFALDGDDVFDGGVGKDHIHGGAGNDILRGGADEDLLDGGTGHDILEGGAGIDIFVFRKGDGTTDILDFELRYDVLDLEGFDGLTYEALTAAGEQVGDDVVYTFGTDVLILRGAELATMEEIDLCAR